MKKLLLLFFILFSYTQASKLTYIFETPKTKLEKEHHALVKNSQRLSELKEFLNDKFIFDDEVKVVFGAEDGPYFEPKNNTITMPYAFVQETKEKFKKVEYDKKENIKLNTAVVDVLIHTIFHELGHALVAMYDIPILGKEEDAVDNLANILLIEYFEDGSDILLTNADIFDLYDREKVNFDEYDFMGEHSLDLQRFYSLLCFVYASEPSKYDEMLTQYDFPADRKDMCEEEHHYISSSWHRVLKSHMKE